MHAFSPNNRPFPSEMFGCVRNSLGHNELRLGLYSDSWVYGVALNSCVDACGGRQRQCGGSCDSWRCSRSLFLRIAQRRIGQLTRHLSKQFSGGAGKYIYPARYLDRILPSGWYSAASLIYPTTSSFRLKVVALLQRLAMSIFMLFICCQALSKPENHVYFAGYGFESQCDQIESKFQYLSAYLGQACKSSDISDESEQFAKLIVKKLPDPSSSLRIIVNGLGTLGAGNNASVLAFVFDGEMVHDEPIGEYYKLLVEVTAQIIAFDFNNMTIIWSKPLIMQYVDLLKSRPDSNDINNALDKILFSESDRSLPSQFANGLADFSPTQSLGLQLGVEDVAVTPGIWKYGSIAQIEDLLASKFTLFLASNLGVSVVPPRKSDAIHNKMAARMADGRVYMLDMPTSDYPIHIKVDKLKKIEFDRTDIEVVNIFGAYITFEVGIRQGDDQIKKIFTEQVKLGVPQRLPSSTVMTESSDGLAYYETIEALFDNFTKAIESPKSDWAKRHMTTTRNPRKAITKLNELKEVIEKCR